MRLFKLAVISAIVLSVILILMSLLIPSRVRISRAVNIYSPAARIHPFLADTRLWKKWNSLYSEPIRVEVIENRPGRVATVWRHGGRALPGAFELQSGADITVVQWYFDFRLKWYPWEKFGSITFDKQFGTPMEQSLNNLKKLVENSP